MTKWGRDRSTEFGGPPTAGSVGARSRPIEAIASYYDAVAVSKKRRWLFLAENLAFTVCMIAVIALVLTGSGSSRLAIIGFAAFAVIVIHATLRLTYFRQLVAEDRRGRNKRQTSDS